VPMGFFRARAFSSGLAAVFLLYAAMYGVLFVLPQFLQAAQGHSPLAAGLRLLPWVTTLLVVAPVAGRLVNRIGERSLVVIGLVLQAIGLAWFAALASPEVPYIRLVAPLIVAGAGVSAAMPAVQNVVLSAVAKPDVGKASGVLNTVRFLGGMSGIAIAAATFERTGGFETTTAVSAGFTVAIGVSAALSLLAATAGLWLPRRRRSVVLAAANSQT
jgi:MFS family permease